MIKTDRAFNVTKKMNPTVSLHQNDKIKKIIIPVANQLQLTIEHFCTEIQNNSNKYNFEKELLDQALIMDAVRNSYTKNSIIKIKN